MKEKKIDSLRNKILLSDDPLTIHRDMRTDEHLGNVMYDIMGYIHHGYEMNDNPLEHLRRTFPRFKWNSHEVNGEEALVRIVLKADYVWGVDLNDDWSSGLITAKQVGRQVARKICLWPVYKDGTPKYLFWPVKKFDRDTGIRLLIQDLRETPCFKLV